MKALEKKAEKYDKGIKFLTLGRSPEIKQYISDKFIHKDNTVLDIGMGTGTFAILCAKKGAKVIGIDNSDKMLEVAKNKIEAAGLGQKIKIIKMPVIQLDQEFSDNSFDKVTALLSFSEFYQDEQNYCLKQIYRILRENGEFILLDEVKPKKVWKRIAYFIIRVPLVFITYLRSQLTTTSLRNIEERLNRYNFLVIDEKLFLLDTLKLFRLKKKKTLKVGEK
jgi:ubiquinone/menaquinone biosynthesis C-methylase UbiE